MLPLTTPRLHVRVMQPSDAPALVAYRNDPTIAAMQGWAQPYTLEMAHEMLAGLHRQVDFAARMQRLGHVDSGNAHGFLEW